MIARPSAIRSLWLLGIAVGLQLVFQACTTGRNVIAEGTYVLAFGPELTSSVDYVTAKRVNETLTVAGRISFGAGIRRGCPGRIQIDLIDPRSRLIDSRTAVYDSKNYYRFYYGPRSARHLRYHRLGKFSAIFWTLPPAGTTIHLSRSNGLHIAHNIFMWSIYKPLTS